MLEKVQLQPYSFWLLIITGLLIFLNWHLVAYNSVCLIFWCAALLVTWQNRNTRSLDSNIFSTCLGLLLITWMSVRSSLMSDRATDVLAHFYPIISCLGICLLATRISHIRHYWREIIIVSLTSIPLSHILSWLSLNKNIAILDAKISRLMLWYVGFDVHQIDNSVVLPTGSIEIAGGCTSFKLLWLMWQFCLVISLCFSLKKNQKVLLALWATIIAFSVNSVRLGLMAFLVVNEHQEAFDYWHGSSGAAIFTNLAVFLFALVYRLLVSHKEEKTQDLSKLYEH
ncbi:cyanoexosortase A [Myxosarcina sp. GI1]|uniref:cyanoexosortase A n=1 Tax=Myxosarcina sp. GI1 TaxID=1541065 RepID=UPI00056D7F60|nr:cyanoexosortase A [Myxosarcina sp. GI1]